MQPVRLIICYRILRRGRGTSLSHNGRNAHIGGSNFIFSRGLFFYPSLVTATSVSINITTSKKDPFRKGIQIILSAADAEICPVKALQIYFHKELANQ